MCRWTSHGISKIDNSRLMLLGILLLFFFNLTPKAFETLIVYCFIKKNEIIEEENCHQLGLVARNPGSVACTD